MSSTTEFRAANNELVRLALRDLLAFWVTLDLSRPERTRDALLRFMPILTTTYGEAAATLAADWYDALRAAESVAGRFVATPAAPVALDRVESRVRFAAGHLFTDTPDKMLSLLDGATNKYVLEPGRATIQQSSIADPRARGWHREVRSGGCDFCRMLAGKGGVYMRSTATFAAHDDCRCTARPSWDANAPEVPVSAYEASKRTLSMADSQKARHDQAIRDYIESQK